jgi:pyruvate, water dikinase
VDFVKNVLGKAVTQDEFEERTYRNEKRDAIAGTLLYRPDLTIERNLTVPGNDLGGVATHPLTLEFFPSDHLTPEHALLAYLLIQERLSFSPLDGLDRRLFYLPAGDTQEAAVAAGSDALAADGALWLRRMDVFQGLTVQYLNPGTAYGTLRVLAPEALDEAVVSFRDVLVLTRLPNKVPLSGGTITGELQTPLAHVNVAARARGTPNMALLGAAEDPRIAPHVGKLVKLVVKPGGFTLEETTLEEATTFWTESGSRPHLVPPADVARDDLAAFDGIGFADRDAFGPKASNVAELSHADVLGTPTAPEGFAVPFHFYDAFLDGFVTAAACGAARVACNEHGGKPEACVAAGDQVCLPGGVETGETLRAWVHRVLADATVATDSSLRWAAMDVLRSLFCLLPVAPAFASSLDSRVTTLFGAAKVRLRSSSNAEDLPGFSGAGLYTSVSANKPGEPASARICEVWGSAWNWGAVEERAFWNVDQEATRMAVAVETSYPDEAANGVLITQNIADPMSRGMYVNVQLGETSVTNPSNGETPEVLSIIAAPDSIQVARQRFSSMSPFTAILSDDEVFALYQAAAKVQSHFAPLYCMGDPKCDADTYALDLEFKFVGPSRDLVVKQVRPYSVATGQQ